MCIYITIVILLHTVTPNQMAVSDKDQGNLPFAESIIIASAKPTGVAMVEEEHTYSTTLYEASWTEDTLTAITIVVWWIVDVIVIYEEYSEASKFIYYLTNEIWILGFVSRCLITFKFVYKWSFGIWCKKYDNNLPLTFDACNAIVFLSYGVGISGVFGAFFLLSYLDDRLLSTLACQTTNLNNSTASDWGKEHTIGELIIWNHLRHVTVIFLHLALLWSTRKYLTSTCVRFIDLNNGHSVSALIMIVVTVLSVPSTIGLVHMIFTDDQALYKYGSTEVGQQCTLAFLIFSLIASIYYSLVVFPTKYLPLQEIDK